MAPAGRERARLRAPTLLRPASRPPGPVTLAIRAVREAPVTEDLRRRLEERIEADLALLDELDGDSDRERENEHGGDIQDGPHDAEEPEPSLGAMANTAQGCEGSQVDWVGGTDPDSDREVDGIDLGAAADRFTIRRYDPDGPVALEVVGADRLAHRKGRRFRASSLRTVRRVF